MAQFMPRHYATLSTPNKNKTALSFEQQTIAQEQTEKLSSCPANFPRPNDHTGLTFSRTYINLHAPSALEWLNEAVRKHIQKTGCAPKAIYCHPSIYKRMEIEHRMCYQIELERLFHTFAPFKIPNLNALRLQPVRIQIYTALDIGVDIPRETIICK